LSLGHIFLVAACVAMALPGCGCLCVNYGRPIDSEDTSRQETVLSREEHVDKPCIESSEPPADFYDKEAFSEVARAKLEREETRDPTNSATTENQTDVADLDELDSPSPLDAAKPTEAWDANGVVETQDEEDKISVDSQGFARKKASPVMNEGFVDGDRVIVQVDFTEILVISGLGEQPERLAKGQKGTVRSHDSDGNVVIEFDGLQAAITVARRNLDKLLRDDSEDMDAMAPVDTIFEPPQSGLTWCQKARLPLATFGGMVVGSSLLAQPVVYISVFGANAAAVGVINIVSTLYDILNTPIFGRMSDQGSFNRFCFKDGLVWGRRAPMALISLPFTAFSFFYELVWASEF